jgi:hypothetical protein
MILLKRLLTTISLETKKESLANYLDRHEVSCEQGKAIQSFNLIKRDDGQIAYEYTCVDVDVADCVNTKTQETVGSNEDGTYRTWYLGAQAIRLAYNQVLKSFKLNTGYKGKDGKNLPYYSYSYTYCNVSPVVFMQSEFIQPVKEDIYTLTDLSVECGDNQALAGFQLKKDTKYDYDFTCTEKLTSIDSTPVLKSTPWNDINDKAENSANFLDRHNCKCDEGQALKGFQLKRNTAGQIAYDFLCVKASFNNCQAKETGVTIGAGKDAAPKISYLTQQKIEIGQNEVLTRFQLQSTYMADSTPKYTYGYTKCTLQ